MIKDREEQEMNEDITLRTDLRPGDPGYIIWLHGVLYKKEHGFGPVFEASVCKAFYGFLMNYNPKTDRLWCAEADGRIIGCIGVVGQGDRARVRWFLLEPAYRGRGMGKKLLESAIDFARACGCRSAYLGTTVGCDTAIALYERAGFVFTGKKPNDGWRKGCVELEYELTL